jgi:prepilin-type N-terminal cleavage/methylation domain-containing protein
MHVSTRPQFADARGFTMVELLVVMLILGILAMIALPAFTSQRLKGDDTKAQQMVRTVATALATYHTDESSYDATRGDLERIEPTVREASAGLEITGTTDGFEITETSRSDTTFTLTHGEDGVVTRSCSIADRGLCKADNTW